MHLLSHPPGTARLQRLLPLQGTAEDLPGSSPGTDQPGGLVGAASDGGSGAAAAAMAAAAAQLPPPRILKFSSMRGAFSGLQVRLGAWGEG